MVTIILRDLKEYDLSSVREYLVTQEDNSFELVMNFPNKPLPDLKFFIHVLYTQAAYFGDLLSKIVDSFSYGVPIDTLEPIFKFRIKVSDIEKLAEIIFNELQFYFKDVEPALHDKYYDSQDSFWDKALQREIETPMWGLIQYGNDCLKK